MKKNCPVKVSSLKMNAGLHFLLWEITRAWGTMICYYISCFDEIHNYLLESLNYFIHGQLSHSQRQAMITLIEKKGKDKRFLKHWRPISLINNDAKITSKCLAFRIRNVLSSLIHSDQTAYVKGRYIRESVRLINDILEYAASNDIEALLFSADFEKSFDSIDHCFLFSVLESFGFGPEILQWVRTLFQNAKSCVMNNGHSTGYFPLERGTRHGDPLSAYLFILALEIMFIQIRNNDQIKGLKIDDTMIKLSAYADDTYFIALDVPSLSRYSSFAILFEEFSSLKLNLDKCQACWIGSAKSKLNTPIDCNWINIEKDKILTLGIFNSYDQSLADKYNSLNLLTSMRDSLNIWEYRGLTLTSRIQIFKCLAVSKTLYACTMLSPSKQFIDQINSLKKDFVWRGKRPKIKHSALTEDYKEGGYKDVDIEVQIVALKIIWIYKLMASDFHAWKAIPNFRFDKIGIRSAFHYNFKPSKEYLTKN